MNAAGFNTGHFIRANKIWLAKGCAAGAIIGFGFKYIFLAFASAFSLLVG